MLLAAGRAGLVLATLFVAGFAGIVKPICLWAYPVNSGAAARPFYVPT